MTIKLNKRAFDHARSLISVWWLVMANKENRRVQAPLSSMPLT